jgi:hypothetical protein
MRLLLSGLALFTMLACHGSTEPPPLQPLDGTWKLDSASPGVPPRTMTLSQRGGTITGTGSAMGVDVPIPINVAGAYSESTHVSPPLISLIFTYENGGGMTAQYSGTLQGSNRIVGSVVYYGITSVPQPGTLSFTRQ